MFGSLLKAVVDTVALPVEAVKDVATLGGLITGKDETYTAKQAKRVADDLQDAVDDLLG